MTDIRIEDLTRVHKIPLSHYVRQHMQLCGVPIDADDIVVREDAERALKSFKLEDYYGPNRISERLMNGDPNTQEERWKKMSADHKRQHKL